MAENDLSYRTKHIQEFLQKGHKVKLTMQFRGREMAHPGIGLTNMNRFAEACADLANIEKPAKLEGRQMLMFLAPKAVK